MANPKPPAGGASLALKSVLFVSGAVVGVIAFYAVAAQWALLAGPAEPPANAPRQGKSAGAPVGERVEALGRLAPKGGVIAIHATPGDRVDEVYVEQGRFVEEGKELVRLASWADLNFAYECALRQQKLMARQREVAERSAAAKLAEAEAEIAQLEAGRADERLSQTLRLGQLQAQRERAAEERNRLEGLSSSVKVSDQELRQARHLADQADAELQSAQAMQKKGDAMLAKGDLAAQAKLAAARAERDQALLRLAPESMDDTIESAKRRRDASLIKAPIAGRVVKLSVAKGHAVTTMPLLQLADSRQMTVVAEVYETSLANLDAILGKHAVDVTATSGALPKPVAAKLSRPAQIVRMIARNSVYPVSPREDQDRRVMEVEADVEPGSAEDAARFIGLQVMVVFNGGTDAAPAP